MSENMTYYVQSSLYLIQNRCNYSDHGNMHMFFSTFVKFKPDTFTNGTIWASLYM